MNELNFTGLANNYSAARPGYPVEMFKEIELFLPSLEEESDLFAFDVGSGTGISTRLLGDVIPGHLKILGVEPNDDMRRQALDESLDDPRISYQKGHAEELDFKRGSAFLICAGQAVQWFDREAFYNQAHQLLVEGGVLALFENNRDWRNSAFLEAHERFLEENSVRKDGRKYSRFYRDHPYAMELLRKFGSVHANQFRWVREMTIDAFISMAASSTQVQRAFERLGEEIGVAKIRAYCEEYANDEGVIELPYVTELYMARKVSISTLGTKT